MADEAITGEPTYTAIHDDMLMVEHALSEERSLIHIFNFHSREITTIYETRVNAGGGPSGNSGRNISAGMTITKFSTATREDMDYTQSMKDKLEELLNHPDEPETEPTLAYESTPHLSA